jgi:hypothetical protein
VIAAWVNDLNPFIDAQRALNRAMILLKNIIEVLAGPRSLRVHGFEYLGKDQRAGDCAISRLFRSIAVRDEPNGVNPLSVTRFRTIDRWLLVDAAATSLGLFDRTVLANADNDTDFRVSADSTPL